MTTKLFEGCEGLEWPQYREQLAHGSCFPNLIYKGDAGELILHPIVDAIDEAGNSWDRMEILSHFNVTGEPSKDKTVAVDVKMVAGGRAFGFSDWWLSHDGYLMYVQAAGDFNIHNRACVQLLQHIHSQRRLYAQMTR